MAGWTLCPTTGVAADTTPTSRLEVTVFGGYRTGGNIKQTTDINDADGNPIKVDAGLNKGASFGLALNWEAESNSFYELAYSRQATSLDTVNPTDIKVAMPLDVTVEYLQIGGYVTAAEKAAKVMPYFVLNAGIGRLTPNNDELRAVSKFSAAIGGGVKLTFTEHIAMRFDARVYALFLGNENDLMCAGSGGVTCKIHLQGDMLVQPDISLGLTFGF
jgi:hypothetical protein